MKTTPHDFWVIENQLVPHLIKQLTLCQHSFSTVCNDVEPAED